MAALLATANSFPDLFLSEGFDSLGNPASSWVYHPLARDNKFPDLFLGEGFDSLRHPAGHGSTVGQSQLIS